jgi:hypothetical protein
MLWGCFALFRSELEASGAFPPQYPLLLGAPLLPVAFRTI